MQMFVDCNTCGAKFNWTVSETETPTCDRCKNLHGGNPREILKILGEHRVPGQTDLIRALSLMLDRIESLEAKKK